MTLLDVELDGPYLIAPETHLMAPAADSWGNRHPARRFEYVIRDRVPNGRPFVFRTETFPEARDIVARILEPGVLSR